MPHRYLSIQQTFIQQARLLLRQGKWLGLAATILTMLAGRAQAQTPTPTWQAAVALTTFSSTSCYVTAATATATGDVFIVGNFSGALSLSNITLASYAGTDAFVAKWSGATNQFVWAQRIGGAATEVVTGVAVNGSSVYLTGSFNSASLLIGSGNVLLANGGGFDAYVVKFADAGTSVSYVWSQRVSGIGFEEGSAVAVSGSSVYLTGYLTNNGAVTFGSLPQPPRPPVSTGFDAYLAKLTDYGSTSTFIWAQVSGGPGDEQGMALAVSGTSVYVAGFFRSDVFTVGTTTLTNAGSSSGRVADVFVSRYADAGTSASLTWAQRTGGLANEMPLALAVRDASVYVAGSFSGTAAFGTTTFVSQSKDAFVVKLSDTGSAGAVTWAQRISGEGDDTGQALALGNAGTVYVTGICSVRPVTFGSVATPAGGSSYVARLADAGPTSTFAWALRGGGGGYDGARAVALTPAGRLYVGGSYTYTGTFGTIVLPDPGTFQLDTGYLAYVQDTPLATTPARRPDAEMQVYPNPAHDQVRVVVPAGTGPAELTVYDALGRRVRTLAVHLPAGGGEWPLSVAGLPAGLYAVQLQAGAATSRQLLRVE